jgi:hypothetical protein
MASDSESSHTGTHSQGRSPDPGSLPALSVQRIANGSMGEMLSPSSARRRTSIKGGMPGIMKRAVSSPNVRDLASLDTSAMSNADKKRNKLGYHRTAVACGKFSYQHVNLALTLATKYIAEGARSDVS